MSLKPGLYERLITHELRSRLEDPRWHAERAPMEADAAPDLLARHIYEATWRALSGIHGKDRESRQLALANALVDRLAQAAPEEVERSDRITPEVLQSLVEAKELGLGTGEMTRPTIPLRHSELIVNGPRDLRVGREVVRELPSADRVDLLMSFIKWTGFVELQEALSSYCAERPLRILTTTYLGASDVEAVEALREIGADVRVSYDHRRTRLHAKAWLFHRDSQFSTALVGSSNLSKAALRDGCEWNVRLSQRDNRPVFEKLGATFEQYWNDPTFEPYERERFILAGQQPRTDRGRDALADLVRLRPLPHQQGVLDALDAERSAGHMHNLVVAATGTGKTVMAALDYARQPGRPRLLFVAHRDHILEQSRAIFRAALRDGSFGEKLTGREKPIIGHHVFASVQSLHLSRLGSLAPAAFEIVIVDEFHHAAAPTYDFLLEHLKPRLLLGLTATPERADGRSILRWFDDRIAAESRLWDALDQELLCPFQYFGVHDDTDLSQVDFRAGRYDVESLERLYTADEHRAKQVLRALDRRVRNPREMRALGFCVSVKHAEYMAEYFQTRGLHAAIVSAETTPARRDELIRALQAGRLCCLFTVDVFNEGVDIPCVDTVLFLRPTESATVFLQQLGRGLRLHPTKSCLTVLDFVAKGHPRFRFDARYRALLGGGTRFEVRSAVQDDFPHLPSGCSIQLEPRARDAVLDNLRRAVDGGWARLAEDLSPALGLQAFLRQAEVGLEELYRPGKTFTALRHLKGYGPAPLDAVLARALPRMLHIDDAFRLRAWSNLLSQDSPPAPDATQASLRMLFAHLTNRHGRLSDLGRMLRELWADEALRRELLDLLRVLEDRSRHRPQPYANTALHMHARYSRREISGALDLITDKGTLLIAQGGVYKCDAQRADLLFVTLNKDEKHFTPTTLYRDYPISPTRFHWESQGSTREDSPTGRRYRSPPPGWRILLFIRETTRDARGETAPFLFAGPVHYEAHEGERPMGITWRLEVPLPIAWFQAAKIAAG